MYSVPASVYGCPQKVALADAGEVGVGNVVCVAFAAWEKGVTQTGTVMMTTTIRPESVSSCGWARCDVPGESCSAAAAPRAFRLNAHHALAIVVDRPLLVRSSQRVARRKSDFATYR